MNQDPRPARLRDWDVVVGGLLLEHWRNAVTAPAAAQRLPVFVECGELLTWATSVFQRRLRSGVRVLPTEALNIEGARIFRPLSLNGWRGEGFVLAGEPDLVRQLATAHAAATAAPAAWATVDVQTDSGDDENPHIGVAFGIGGTKA